MSIMRTRGSLAATLAVAAVVGSGAMASGAAIYSGNGNTGFGGPLGSGTLSISDDVAGNINFTFNAGGSGNNDYLVVYIDSVSGGFASTSGLNDHADENRRAISGTNDTDQSLVTFASGFNADYALSTPGAGQHSQFAGLWGLATGGPNSLNYVASANIGGTQNATTFSITAAELGLTANSGQSFKFVATYLNGGNTYRSDEAIGNIGITGNPGGPPSSITFSDSRTYTLVPEPASLGLLAVAGVWGLRRRR